MEPNLFLVFPFIIVVVAIVMGTIGKITKHAMELRHREKTMHMAAPAVTPQVTARLDEMEQRLRVLERIATEDRQGTALAAEIEALRHDAGTPLAMPAARTGENVQ